jgi:hypothetical protein
MLLDWSYSSDAGKVFYVLLAYAVCVSAARAWFLLRHLLIGDRLRERNEGESPVLLAASRALAGRVPVVVQDDQLTAVDSAVWRSLSELEGKLASTRSLLRVTLIVTALSIVYEAKYSWAFVTYHISAQVGYDIVAAAERLATRLCVALVVCAFMGLIDMVGGGMVRRRSALWRRVRDGISPPS